MEDAINIAGNNLLSVTPDDADALWEKVGENFWISKLNDDYDAARIFTFPEHMRLPFKRPAIAYAPAHAILLITNKRDEDTLGRMVEFGNDAAEAHRPLSQALWEQTETGWKRLTSTKRNSVIWQAALADDTIAYAEQKNILGQVFEKKEKDIFVASVMTVEEKSGEILTLAVFIGENCYLPVVDCVVLPENTEQDQSESVKIPWSRFVDILGPERLKAVPELTPKRLLFDGEMTEDLRRQLNAAAAPL